MGGLDVFGRTGVEEEFMSRLMLFGQSGTLRERSEVPMAAD